MPAAGANERTTIGVSASAERAKSVTPVSPCATREPLDAARSGVARRSAASSAISRDEPAPGRSRPRAARPRRARRPCRRASPRRRPARRRTVGSGTRTMRRLAVDADRQHAGAALLMEHAVATASRRPPSRTACADPIVGWPGERELAPRREDAQPIRRAGGRRRQHERRLRQVRPRGDALHGGVVEVRRRRGRRRPGCRAAGRR